MGRVDQGGPPVQGRPTQGTPCWRVSRGDPEGERTLDLRTTAPTSHQRLSRRGGPSPVVERQTLGVLRCGPRRPWNCAPNCTQLACRKPPFQAWRSLHLRYIPSKQDVASSNLVSRSRSLHPVILVVRRPYSRRLTQETVRSPNWLLSAHPALARDTLNDPSLA